MPPAEIRRLRDLTRLRKSQINERGRSIQRLEQVLQDAGINLTNVASHTYSKSAPPDDSEWGSAIVGAAPSSHRQSSVLG